jgi:hypothetical protein
VAAVVVGLGVAYAVSQVGHHDVASPGSSTSPSIAPSTPSATTHQSVASWSGGQQIDIAAELVSVSCASTKFCAAVDSGGSAYTYSGGSWSKPRPLSSGPLSWVSCPTAGSCVATSDGADTVYTYSNGTWSSPDSLIGDDGKSAHLTSVSCPSVSFCMATGGRDAYVYTGASWSQGVLLQDGSTSKFTAISCSSAAFCAAVDSGGRVHTYSAGSWSKPQSLSRGGLSWVSCPTARSCVATSDGADTLYAYAGGTWSSPSPLIGADGNPAHLTSVSCPTSSFCMATGGLNAYTYSGKKWKQGRMVHKSHQFAAISCVSANFCTAVDSGGNVYTYAPPRSS